MIIFSNLNPIIYFLTALLIIPIAMILILRKKKPFSSYKLGCMLFAGCAYWLLFYILELSSRSLEFKIIFSQLQYIGIATVPITLFILTVYFSGYNNWVNIKTYLMLAIIPLVALAFVFSNGMHHLFWRETTLISTGKYFLMEIKYGIVFYIFAGYIYSLIIVSFVVLLKTLTQKIRLFRLQSIILISSLSIATVSNILYVLRLLPFKNFDITPIALTVSSVLLTYGIVYLKIGNIIPLKLLPEIDDKRDFSIILNNQNMLLSISTLGLKILNTNLQSVIGKDIREIIPGAEKLIKKELNDIKEKDTISFIQDQVEEIFDINLTALIENNKSVTGKIFILKNITEKIKMQKALEESGERYKSIFENSIDGIYQSTPDGKYIDANPALIKMLGYESKEELFLKNIKTDIYYSEKDRPNIESRDKPFETMLKKKNGAKIWVEINSRAVTLNGVPQYFEGIVRNIDNRKISEERIKYLSFHDHLTGLYNRYFFEEELIRLDSGRLYPTSLILADINGLKLINDAFGHKKGDEILIAAAKIFKQCFRKEDIVSRWGGDEFCMILPNTDEQTALNIADRIQKKFSTSFIDSFELSLSFGVSTKTSENIGYEEIVKIAEDKMFRHKLINKQSAHSNIITSLSKALEERNYETHEHARRMSTYANLIGKELGLETEKIDELNLLSSLHDIGKISISDNIVLKPGKLTEEEFEIMKKHPEIGYKIAKSTPELTAISKGILTHQEKWDGTGYPLQLKGEEIPLIARIIAVVDAFDAMTNDRPYRKALGVEKAIEELKIGAGTQFDKSIVEKFLEIINRFGNDLNKVNKIIIKKIS
ncbi:MAG: histidine kinase N-terminal 7TM domain-containing protein [Candidatus Humimicrobiaceae bacterium]